MWANSIMHMRDVLTAYKACTFLVLVHILVLSFLSRTHYTYHIWNTIKDLFD